MFDLFYLLFRISICSIYYSESLSHLAEGGDCNTAEQDETETDVPVQSIPRSPSSILRQRKSGDGRHISVCHSEGIAVLVKLGTNDPSC